MKNSFRQQGIALGVVLVVVALIGAISFAMVAASRSGSTDTSVEQDRLLASAILVQSQHLADAYARVTLPGDAPYNLIATGGTLAVAEYGLYGPRTGLSAQKAPTGSNAIQSSSYWFYTYGLEVTLPDESLFAIGVVLPHLREGVCRQLNQILGVADIASGGKFVEGAGSGWVGSRPSASMLVSLDNQVQSLCVKNQSGTFSFYRLLDRR